MLTGLTGKVKSKFKNKYRNKTARAHGGITERMLPISLPSIRVTAGVHSEM
jgi:hypothetical protein